MTDDIDSHIIVDASPDQYDLRVIAGFLRLERQVVGIDTDAMPAGTA